MKTLNNIDYVEYRTNDAQAGEEEDGVVATLTRLDPHFVIVRGGSNGGKLLQLDRDRLAAVVDFVNVSSTCVGCVVVMESSSYGTLEMAKSLDAVIRCLRD